jgi:hypothetical protein
MHIIADGGSVSDRIARGFSIDVTVALSVQALRAIFAEPAAFACKEIWDIESATMALACKVYPIVQPCMYSGLEGAAAFSFLLLRCCTQLHRSLS